VIVNSAIALFAERPLLLAEAGSEEHGHGTSLHGAGHHAAPPYRRLVAFLGPAVVGASFLVSLLSVLARSSDPRW